MIDLNRTSMLVKKEPFYLRQRRALEMFGERPDRPQEEFPEYYRHARKINYGLLDTSIRTVTDSDLVELTGFVPSNEMTAVNENCLTLYPKKARLMWVDSTESFDTMLLDIMSQSEIAVDLEGHSEYSFRGTTALIQLSTQNCDYLICPFATRIDIQRHLKNVMENHNIAKVFHAIDNDFLALRRDFGITTKGAVDTKEAFKLLDGWDQSIGFNILLEKLGLNCKCDMPDKSAAQLADWRLRPLPNKLLVYARHDSHALLRAWNLVKMKLHAANIPILDAFTKTANLLNKLKYIPPKQEDPIKGWSTLKPVPTLSIKTKFIDLHRWRHQVAMMTDCSPKSVLTNAHLVEIIQSNPRNATEMQKQLDTRFPIFLRGKQGLAFYKVYSMGMRLPDFDPKCHNCFLNSHQAWTCWKSKDKHAWKRYMNRPENKEHKKRQYERRMKKWKENKERRQSIDY